MFYYSRLSMGLGFFIFLVIVLPIIIIFSVTKLRNCFFDWLLVDVLGQEDEEPEEVTEADIQDLLNATEQITPTPAAAPAAPPAPTDVEAPEQDATETATDTEPTTNDSTSGYRIRRSHEPVPFVW
jgi:hypothetical protein